MRGKNILFRWPRIRRIQMRQEKHLKRLKQPNLAFSMQPTPFTLRVQDVVRSIPKGQTLSYKEVATLAGKPNAARAVGTIMAKNQDKSVPCHRVVKSDGTPGGYNGLRGEKEQLLRSEGALGYT